MTSYAKTMMIAFALSAVTHVVGAVFVFPYLAGLTPLRLPTANRTEVTKLTLIEVPPSSPPKYEPPKVIPPALVEKPTPPLATPSPRVEQPAPIAAPTNSQPTSSAKNSQLTSSASVASISSLSSDVQVMPSVVQPEYDYNPKPRYPREARNHGWQGTTLLRVEVKPSGEACKIEVAQSSGYALLDDASVEAVRSWKFVPARLGDQAVAGAVEVPITYKLVAN